MSDRWVLLLAACAALGARLAAPAPLSLAVVLVVVALAWRRPWLLCLGAMVLASVLGHRALAGLDGVAAVPVRSEVTLLTDPIRRSGSVRADVRLGHRRLEARASGAAGAALIDRLAGERVRVDGSVSPRLPGTPWLIPRHVGGTLRVATIESWREGTALTRLANGLRRTLHAGTASLNDRQRSLFDGLVIGDDRRQSADAIDDFRAAGLSHLLAVSGQNVAFVLVLASPLLGRLRLWTRFAASVAVLGFFALVTRFEPSVLRAVAVAILAALTFSAGRSATRLRLLALAVTGLVLIDPLLVHSIGFGLSTAASASILLLAAPIAAAIPGPRALAEALGVTLAAQLGVAPILLAVFGPLPVASIPANLLAVPAAGPIMMYGLAAGTVAGLLGGTTAAALHLPSAALLVWIDGVARRSALLPLGQMQGWHVVGISGGLGVAAIAGRHRWCRVRRGCIGLAVLLVLLPAATLPAPPAHASFGAGAELWTGGGAAIVRIDGRADAGSLLQALRRAGVSHLDVLVVGTASGKAAETAMALRRRYQPQVVLTPPGAPIAKAMHPARGQRVGVGDLVLVVDAADPSIRLTVRRPPSGGPRGSR